jgi:hypothetical protein
MPDGRAPFRAGLPTPEEALLSDRRYVHWGVAECLRNGVQGWKLLPGLVLHALEIEVWKGYPSESGKLNEPGTLRAWVEDREGIGGLGSSYSKICAMLERADPDETAEEKTVREEALAAFRKAWNAKIADNRGNPTGRNQHSNEETLRYKVSSEPGGVAKDKASHDMESSGRRIEPWSNGTDNAPSRPGTTYGTADYMRARLARDADPNRSKLSEPDRQKAAAILEQLDRGEMRPHRAAKEMGYRKTPSSLDIVKRAWAKADEEERKAIAAWIGAQAVAASKKPAH